MEYGDALAARKQKLGVALRTLKLREERKRQSSEGGLMHFVRYFWSVLEPGRPMVEGWVIEAICLHLEAVTFGDIKRLLINVPPGFMKSMLVNVFFPAWEWGPMRQPQTRYVSFSYGSHLTERDNAKFRDLVNSPEYQELWGDRFNVTKDGEVKVGNDKTGWKFASSVGGVGTGERGDRVLLDDAHNVREAESDPVRTSTVNFFRESMSNRLNDLTKDAIIVIMQRVHENDVSGEIMSHDELGYVKLVIPMEYESHRHCSTEIGWSDPRTEEGELAWPERFPPETLAEFKTRPYMWAGQYQQAPEPRGGGIIKRHYWQYYDYDKQVEFGVAPHSNKNIIKYPAFDYVVASLDSAYTEKEENDPSGFTCFGVFTDKQGRPNIMLIMAWRKRLELHGEIIQRRQDEAEKDYIARAQPHWGLVEWVAYECRRRSADVLLIEGKASGLSVAQEIKRLYGNESFSVQIVNPRTEDSVGRGGNDKVARLWAVQHLFQDGLIWVPVGQNGYPLEFAEDLISEAAVYPKGLKDMTDSMVYALRHLRRAEHLLRKSEFDEIDADRRRLTKALPPLYPA